MVVLGLQQASELPGGIVHCEMPGATSECLIHRSGVGPENLHSNKIPGGDGDDAYSVTILGESLVYWLGKI